MDFMFSAGVRLGIRERLVKLPDEETLLMYDKTIKRLKHGRPVIPGKDYYLCPGEQVVVPIHYGSNHPLQDVVWAGRGDRWVTQLIYGAKAWVTAVKVVNISNRDLVLEWNVTIAEIVPYGSFPQAGQFVRPGLRRYLEWQQLIHENTESKQARLRARRFAQMLRVSGPSVVETSDYEWPTKMLLRPRTETGTVRMVQLHPRPQPVLITMAKPLVSNAQAVLSVVKPEVPLTSRTIAVQTDPVMVDVGTQTDFPDNDTQDASSILVEQACSDRASERCATPQVAGVSEVPNDDTSSDDEPDAQ
ncbi:hypothetical protein F444_14842, partial [Phytophthora nicotianae P1976]